MPADLTDEKWDRGSTDGEIFAVIMKGAGPKFEMKGLEGKNRRPGGLANRPLPPQPRSEDRHS